MILLHNAIIVTGDGARPGSVAVSGERISGVWYPDDEGLIEFEDRKIPFERLPETFTAANGPDNSGNDRNNEVLDLDGKLLFAGGIDAHVHFREPGLTSKADMETESRAAVAGGVTSFIDMPNTTPPTVSAERIEDKAAMAERRAYANYGFHIGATNSNFPEIRRLIRENPESFGGIKVFMGSSTGNMLVDNDGALSEIFGTKEKEVLVHCEDENIIRENTAAARQKYGDEGIPFRSHEDIRSRKACIRSSAKALELAMRHGTRLHLLHISTAEEIEMVRAARQSDPGITSETSVNYLWFCDNDYDSMGSRVKCNPAIKTSDDRAALRKALKDGMIDTVGTDHAPHLESEKERSYLNAPSGMPSIQHTLPVLLTVAKEEDIPLSRIASVFSEKAAEMFGIEDRGFIRKGCYADIVVADPEKEFTVQKEDLLYKCGWSPYEGVALKGSVDTVFVNGHKTIADGKPRGTTPSGKRLVFRR